MSNEPLMSTLLMQQARMLIEQLQRDLSAARGENMLLKRRIAHLENVPLEMIW